MSKPHFSTLTFADLQHADTIVVTTNLNRQLATVQAAQTIAAVLAFLNQHQDGWTIPREGVPVAKIRMNFYQGDRLLGNVGVGYTFLTAHQFGGFFSKSSTEADRNALLTLLGLAV